MSNAVKVFKHFQTPKVAGVYHRLICLTGERKGIDYFLVDKKRIVLGRAEDTDIRIFDLKSSREHAEIIQVGEEWIVSDLGSQNGVIVNDPRVKQHVLNDGDKLIIGKTVFKFSRIIVEDENKLAENSFLKEQEYNEAEEDKKKDKRLSLILMVVVLLAVIMLGTNDSEDEEVKTVIQSDRSIESGADESFNNAAKRKAAQDRKTKKTLGRYFRRGLREYREGNYFRAYVEFDNARQWNPKNPLANFYLRKTKEKQNEIISGFFSKGLRDMEALNYTAAITAYCSIVRLLVYHIPDDKRITEARDKLRIIEERTGADDKSIVCIKK